MCKILFIVPPHISSRQFMNPAQNERVVHKKSGSYGSVLTDMPLGVLALSAYIKKHASVKTKLLDFNVALNKLNSFKYGSLLEYFQHELSSAEIVAFNPDIIALSVLFTPAYQSAIEIADSCHDLFSQSIIIAGGSVPTNMYQEVFNASDSFDALCYGEGEKPLLSLIQSRDKQSCFEKSPTWITKRKVQEKEFFQHDFINNLDEIPFYDYEICDLDMYGLNPAITAYASIGNKKQNFHVMTSRGCPHRCCFCSSHTVHGRDMRYYSVNRVRSDFTRLKEQYDAKTIIFQDDHFVATKERALEIIKIVQELGLKAIFQNGLALYALSRQMLEAIKEAGVDQLLLSVESGSFRVLKEIMHKPLDLKIVKQVADDCRDLDIYTNVNILIGLPGETMQDIDDARQFLKTINANWFLIFCANPLVGSEMFEICKEKSYLRNQYVDSDYKRAIIETDDFTTEYIQETAYQMNLELNFVNNSDFRLGNYLMALKGFENAIKAKNDHAFAYYFASKCYTAIDNFGKAEAYLNRAKEIVSIQPFWKNYADMFLLELA